MLTPRINKKIIKSVEEIRIYMGLPEINKFAVEVLDLEIAAQWQHAEQMHISKSQIGIIRDIRQIELLRDYLNNL